jgi:hypothetical protein
MSNTYGLMMTSDEKKGTKPPMLCDASLHALLAALLVVLRYTFPNENDDFKR